MYKLGDIEEVDLNQHMWKVQGHGPDVFLRNCALENMVCCDL